LPPANASVEPRDTVLEDAAEVTNEMTVTMQAIASIKPFFDVSVVVLWL
jgi:hypothetical protein